MPTATFADETRSILVETGAILSNDHFVYIAGDHGSGWIDKDVIFVNLAHTARLGELLAAAVRDLGMEILCGPATGGLIVAQWTGYALGLPAVLEQEVPSWPAEDCPLCKAGVPINTRYAHGQDFLDAQAKER